VNDTRPGAPRRKQAWLVLRSFLVAELFKLRHSRIVKSILATTCITPLCVIGLLRGLKADVSAFPGVLQLTGGILWVLTGVTMLLLTADWIGNEFEQDTVRMVVGRGVPRWTFVVGKGIALLGVAAMNALTGWLMGGIAAVVSHSTLVGSAGLGEGIGALMTSGLAAVGIVILEAAAYIGIGLFIGILTRSPAFTMLGGLGFFVGELFLEAFPLSPGQQGRLGPFSILGSAHRLLTRLPAAMAPASAAPGQAGTRPGTAAFALVCYAIVGTVLACVLFQRRDLGGK